MLQDAIYSQSRMTNAIVLDSHESTQEVTNDGDAPLYGTLTINIRTIGGDSQIQEAMKKRLLEEVEKITRELSLQEYERGR